MFDYKRLIYKSIKSRTLFTDFFGYGLVKSGFADKYLAGQITMYKAYRWLEKKFRFELENKKVLRTKIVYSQKWKKIMFGYVGFKV